MYENQNQQTLIGKHSYKFLGKKNLLTIIKLNNSNQKLPTKSTKYRGRHEFKFIKITNFWHGQHGQLVEH